MEFSDVLCQKLHLFSVFFQIDGENSIWIEVFLFFRWRFQMEEVKAVADEVTLDNNSDGIAAALEKHGVI